jgi:hypothetical protein
MSNPQLLSGARGVIFKGQTALAVATDITVNVRHTVRPTFVLGDMNAAAIDSLSYDVDVSVGRVIPVNTQNADAGAANRPAVAGSNAEISAVSLGLETVIAAMTSSSDITIALQDRVSGAYIASVQGCRFSGRTQSMNANDIANERINFVGIYDAGYASASGGSDNTPGNIASNDPGLGYGV